MARHPLTPIQRASRLAADQRGLIHIRQAVGAGLSDDQVEHLVAVAGWERIVRSLYAAPGSAPSWERDAMAACLLAGEGTLSSHLTGAALWHWCRAPVLPQVLVGPTHSTRTRHAKVHRSRRPIALVDRTTRNGIPCTGASRTIVDCAGVVERPQLECFVDDAICAGVASVDSINAAADRAGRQGRIGMLNLDAVLDVWAEDIRPDGPAEMRVVRRLDELGAEPVTQFEVYDDAGLFVARLDLALPERKQGFEYDSDRWHNPRHWAKDESRYARLRALGWKVDPVCKVDLLPSSTRLADLLAAGQR